MKLLRHENAMNSTIASGATRFLQNGSVVFFQYNGGMSVKNELTLTDDAFMLHGRQLGSGFGYSVAVTDLNNDG